MMILCAAIAVSVALASCGDDNGCEKALQQVVTDTTTVCAESGYEGTPFCMTCATAGYYSTTGPTDCQCRLLAYDQPFCTYAGGDESVSAIRGAIAWANQNCASFSLPGDDAGTGDSAGASDTASSEQEANAD